MKKLLTTISIMIVVILATALFSCETEEITVREETIETEDKMYIECTLNSDSIYTNAYTLDILESKKFVRFRADSFPQVWFWYDTLATIDTNSILGQDMNIVLGYVNTTGSHTYCPLDPNKTYGDFVIDIQGDSILNANFDIVTECYDPSGADEVYILIGSINELPI